MRNGCSGCWTDVGKCHEQEVVLAGNNRQRRRDVPGNMFGTILTVQLGQAAATLVCLDAMAAGLTVFAVASAWVVHLGWREGAWREGAFRPGLQG